MATVQSEIFEDFFTRLGGVEDIDAQQVKALRALFKSGNTMKAGDLVAIFSARKKEEGAL